LPHSRQTFGNEIVEAERGAAEDKSLEIKPESSGQAALPLQPVPGGR
jgi:hypothetical protein